jgi:hypothetical protein
VSICPNHWQESSSIQMTKRRLRQADYRDYLDDKWKTPVLEISRQKALDGVDDFATRRK